jgi:hypothetical protein
MIGKFKHVNEDSCFYTSVLISTCACTVQQFSSSIPEEHIGVRKTNQCKIPVVMRVYICTRECASVQIY